MRIAFIGASHWHLPLYLDPALAVEGVEVVGISDPDAAVTARLAERLGCAGETDYRELCRKVRPDFVFALGRHIDMPDEARFLIAEDIPLAIEKPCGVSLADVEAIAATAERAGAFASVPLVIRNGAFFRLLEDMRDAEGLQYASFRFIAGFPQRYLDAGCAWMLDPALAGGGCMINLAPHFFDLALQLLGPETVVTSVTVSNAGWGYPVEDYAGVTFANGGRLCVAETGYLYPGPTSTFDMHFTARSPRRYVIARDQESVEIIAPDGTSRIEHMGTTNVPQYGPYVRDVLQRVSQGKPPLASLSDMVPVMRLMEDAYRLAGPLPRASTA